MSNTAKAETDTEAKEEEEEEEEEEGGAIEIEENVCASCGIAAAAVDNIKLEECNDCDLVKYCGDRCREDHREQHEEECKNREAVLHDRKLFTQPDETHLGECPLCFLPLPLDKRKSGFYTCCSIMVCQGCVHANLMANEYDEKKALSCPFCREPATNKEENKKKNMERVKANDPAAMRHMGGQYYDKRNYESAVEYLTKAAELGDSIAHFLLGMMYKNGRGMKKDKEKAVYHYEKAAMGGHPTARYNLGCHEGNIGNIERAVKHFIIASNLGHDKSTKELWKHYSLGNITKEDLDATLRAHQAALDAMKSEQRDIADYL